MPIEKLSESQMKKKKTKAYNFLGGKMKKILSFIGMISLITSSFIICEKTAIVVKETDNLMIEIKEKKKNYEKDPINAQINNNEIIPGLNGRKVNVEKSYDNMKKIGSFNENYIIYDDVKPEISYKKNYDKYIVKGNDKKNMISLIFIVKENNNIDNILNILENNNIKTTFFIDETGFKNNNELVLSLINKGHTIGCLSNDYNNSKYINNILKKLGKQHQNYCYKTENIDDLKTCSLQKNYTIKPNIVIKNNPLTEIKKNISSGSLIELEINDKTNNELDLIIKYIKSKGYKLENLQNHINENLE